MKIYYHENDLPASLDLGKEVAIDTETMGLHVHRDRLCLIQLSSGNKECHLVQIKQNGPLPTNLIKILIDESILKIFHFARFDVSILYKTFETLAFPIYCTKIASKLARTYTDKHSLKELCKEIIGIELSKQEQSSDWGKAVLSEEQKRYAATDVLYLHQLKQHLDQMLVREGRMDIAKAAFAFLPFQAKLDVLATDQFGLLNY